MPTGGRPEFAALAIRCFLAQDYPATELIVVNDSDQPLDPALTNHPRIRLLTMPGRATTGAKRNLACREARGEIIIQWDDDDWHGPQRIRRQIEPLLNGRADITALSEPVVLNLQQAEFWQPAAAGPGRPGFADGHCGTLGYLRTVWEKQTCYPDCSQGEDVAFLRTAMLAKCRFEAVLAGYDFVYVRHGNNVSDLNVKWQEQGDRFLALPSELAAILPVYRQFFSRRQPQQPAPSSHAGLSVPVRHGSDRRATDRTRHAKQPPVNKLGPLLAELRGPARPRPPHWDQQAEVIEAHSRLMDAAAAEALMSQPPTDGAGRGIVTLGGTSKYFVAAWVMASVLRRLGCKLPIEWWFLGPEELAPEMVRLAQSLPDVTCIDLRQRLAQAGRTPRIVAGWQAKVWSVMYSRFAEVLFLDADQVPARDPTDLFEDPAYRQAGALFWPDFLPFGWTVDATAFRVAGLPIPGNTRRADWHNPTDYKPFETGQMLIDKRRHWPALELTRHIGDHSDFWFPAAAKGHHPWHIHGDKDAFFLAWHRLRATYAMPPESIFTGSSEAGAILQWDLAGRPLFQHRTQPAAKWLLHGENHEPPNFLHHDLCVAALQELRSRWTSAPDKPEASLPPLSRHRVAPELLLPGKYQFNNSLIRFRGKLLMAYRLNWTGARIALAELDESYRPLRNWLLDLPHGDAQEDPRLWTFRGELHVSYTAYYHRGTAPHTDVTYARLEEAPDGWNVAEAFAPRYDGRSLWEKNWGFFEHDGELHCLYSIKTPTLLFRVLRVDSERCQSVAEHACAFGGKAGVLHGGAPPALHQGEYYAWFHRRLGETQEKTYTMDLMTFEARPPFRPSRQIAGALLTPNPADRPDPSVPRVVFPGGAMLENNAWIVSFGYHDKWSEIARWDVNHIESAMVPLPGGPFDGLCLRDDDGSRHVWKQVYLGNEYHLPSRMDGQTVVDVGAHVGSFSRACLDRGAKSVVSCEPDRRSLSCLRANLADYRDRNSIVAAYITADPQKHLPAQYAGRMTPDSAAGRVALSDLIGDGVDWLKLDCEGPEHEMASQVDLSRVRNLVGEVHRRGDLTGETFAADLRRQGFEVQIEGHDNVLWNFWARRM